MSSSPRSFILSLIFASIAAFGTAQATIRNFVPIIKPLYPAKTLDFLNKLGDSMRRDGYTEAADIIKAYAAGSFGSGFICVGQDGSDYVVTNRHVVSQADVVTLEFDRPDGSVVSYSDCPVLAVGEEVDLALIAFPKGSKPFDKGLRFVGAPLADGAEVWSAGYPGLGGTPSWQLGKGNVTNAAARIPALVDPSVSTLIQHSAQIDAGNSGGPLLVADESAPAGYSVAGVNAWKAIGRQATNFSIPAAATAAFISETIAKRSGRSTSAKDLESRCRGFIVAVSTPEDAYTEMSKYISNAYVISDGEASIKKVLSTAPTAIRNDIIDAFSNESPVEGIRRAIAYDIDSSIKATSSSAPLGFVAIDGDANAGSGTVPVRFTLAGKEESLYWISEHGVWQLASYPRKAEPKEKTKTAGTSSVSLDSSPYTTLVQVGPEFPFGCDSNSVFWRLTGIFIPDKYFGWGLSAGFKRVDYAEDSFYGTDTETVTDMQIDGRLRGQLPIRTARFSVVPYADFAGGLCLGSAGSDASHTGGSGFFSALEGGVNMNIEAIRALFVGCSYRYYLSAPDDFKGSALSIRVGLGFAE